jgi:hypothetical protein
MIVESRSLVKGLRGPVNRTWDCSSIALAETFLFDKLRQGTHPGHVEWEVREELAMMPYGSYKWHYLQSLLSMLSKLRIAGSFAGLLSLAELNSVERIVEKRIILEQMIKERFMRQDMESMVCREVGMRFLP